MIKHLFLNGIHHIIPTPLDLITKEVTYCVLSSKLSVTDSVFLFFVAFQRGTGANRKSSPLEDKSGVYSLAKSVGPVRSPVSKPPFKRTLSEPSGESSLEEDPGAEYDHLSTWKSKAPESPRSPRSPHSPGKPSPAQYEDPWDSRGKQEQFNQICEKAELASKTSQPTSPTSPNRSTKRMDVYEDAWDTDFKQKQLEARLLEARRVSESKPSKPRYEYEEPVSSHTTKPAAVPQNSSAEQVYSSNYEQPWDSRQKEQELEARFSRVRLSGGQGSPGSPPPPDFAPPPPPMTYEEAWDIRPPSKIISQVSSKYQPLTCLLHPHLHQWGSVGNHSLVLINIYRGMLFVASRNTQINVGF